MDAISTPTENDAQTCGAAAMMGALSHEARLRVLCDLVTGERTAGDWSSVPVSASPRCRNISAKLREEGLVANWREGQSIFYRIADPDAARLLDVLLEIYCKR